MTSGAAWTELFGRGPAIALIEQALSDARAGATRLVLLSGEPGIGKTRLAEEAVVRATDSGMSVAWASCVEGDFAPALWPWAQILHAFGDDSSLVVNATAEGVADVARFPVFTRVLDALRRVANERGSLLIVIDDLHWADDDSARLLTFGSIHLRDLPIVFVVTYRPRELASEHLATLIRTGVEIELRGLDVGAVGNLVAALTGTEPVVGIADQIHTRCAGNPLFVRELTRLLDARPGSSPADLPIPGGVRAVLDRRLARVPQPVVAVLQAAAVLGTTAPITVLSAMTDTPVTDLLEGLEAARTIGVVDTDEHEVVFAHALVREAVYESTAANRRAALHERAAIALERGDRDDRWAAVATHWLRSGRAPERVAIASRHAARHARQRLAFADAAAHLSRAVDALVAANADESPVIDALLEQADMRLRAGQADIARDLYLDVAARARRRGRADELAMAALGLGAGLAGFEVALRDFEQVSLLEEALDGALENPSVLRALVSARLAVASFFVTPRRHEPLALATEAVRIARECNDDRATGYALSALCDALAGPEHCATRLAHATEIVTIGRRLDPAIELLGRRLRLRALLELGDLRAADGEITAFDTVATRLGQPLYSWYPPLWRGMRALTLGHFDDVERSIAEAAALGAAAQSENATMLTDTLELWRALFAGEPAPPFPPALIESYADLVPTLASLGASIAFSALLRGNLDEAAHYYELFAHDDFVRVGGDAEELLNLSNLADVAIALDDQPRLLVLYDRLAPFADLCIVDGIGGAWVGPVHMTLARIASAIGRTHDVGRHLVAARDRCVRAGAPFITMVVDDLARRLDSPADTRPVAVASTGDRRPARFRRNGGVWELWWDDERTTMRDAKGLRDLSQLLARPGTEVHVRDLMGVDHFETKDLGEVLDRAAREAYRRRLRDLDADLVAAEHDNDLVRAEHARIERDFLVAELSAAVGIGGRVRRAGDHSERARKAVAGRVKQSIDRIAVDAPALARHLRNSVKTGTFCSYQPEQPVDWQL